MTIFYDPLRRPELTNAIGHVGAVIRYGFYFTGVIVLAVVGMFFSSANSFVDYFRVTKVDDSPSFHLAATHLSKYQGRTQIFTGGRFGRMELLQYGSFHNRDVNFNVGMGFPRAGAIIGHEPAPQISSLMPSNIRTVMSSSYHDLETRFGSIRATEVRLESDGQWKQCLAFVSRFDISAVYLIGWFCDATGAKPSPATLACTIDKLTLDKDLASKEANTFMRTQMARPALCSAIPVSQTTDMRQGYGYERSRMSPPQRWSTPSPVYRRY